jgi:hypothetical protein
MPQRGSSWYIKDIRMAGYFLTEETFGSCAETVESIISADCADGLVPPCMCQTPGIVKIICHETKSIFLINKTVSLTGHIEKSSCSLSDVIYLGQHRMSASVK